MTKEDGRWEQLEFHYIDFGDKRLDDRFTSTVEKLAKPPMAPINQACTTWSDTKGPTVYLITKKLRQKKYCCHIYNVP